MNWSGARENKPSVGRIANANPAQNQPAFRQAGRRRSAQRMTRRNANATGAKVSRVPTARLVSRPVANSQPAGRVRARLAREQRKASIVRKTGNEWFQARQ